MAADVLVIMVLCLPVLAVGYGVGVHRFTTGLLGVLTFIGFSALWGLAFTCFPYAVALRTGNPAAVNACFVVFFPLFFLTDAVVPKALLTGWFSTIATYNPVTYLLGALRSLISGGWQLRPLLEGWARAGGSGSSWNNAGSVWVAGSDPDGRIALTVRMMMFQKKWG